MGEKGWPMRWLSLKVHSLLLSSLLLGACAALAPQVFAPDIAPARQLPAAEGGASAPAGRLAPVVATPEASARIAVAVDNARVLQRRFVASAQSLSSGNSAIGASLIGLGTVGGVKAVSNPSSHDIAGLAAVLGGLFTYGNTMLPQARVEAYVTGVQALECAIESANALDVPELAAESKALRKLQAELDYDLFRLQGWARPMFRTRSSGGPTADCGRPAPACSAAIDDQRYRDYCAKLAAQQARACAPASFKQEQLLPHPDVEALRNWAEGLRSGMNAGLQTADRYQVQIDLAGGALLGRTRAIEKAVSAEVAKTEPNLTAIKTAVAGSLEAGSAFIPLPKAATQSAPPAASPANAGKALSSDTVLDSAAVGTQDRPAELDAVGRHIEQVAQTWGRVQGLLISMDERLRRSRSLEACTLPGVARPLSLAPPPEPQRASEAAVQLDDALRLRLAPLLGVDPKQSGATRAVDEALKACQARGAIADAGGSGSIDPEVLTAILIGRCRKP